MIVADVGGLRRPHGLPTVAQRQESGHKETTDLTEGRRRSQPGENLTIK